MALVESITGAQFMRTPKSGLSGGLRPHRMYLHFKYGRKRKTKKKKKEKKKKEEEEDDDDDDGEEKEMKRKK